MRGFYKLLQLVLLCTFSVQVALAQFTLSGTVKDAATGEGLVGVNVIEKGTTNGTITDIDGNYRVTLTQNNVTLVFSSIGFISKEIVVNSSQSNLDMDLSEDVTNLEEVVVTGLASSIKRSNLANAVGTVSADELMGTTKAQTVDNALYGKLTGATIKANGGAPGGGSAVQLRGISTISNGNSQPLYIIDGVYVNNTSIQTGISSANGAGSGQSSRLQDDISNRLADINPDDIESIEVLKGSSAAAIYGTRANAGVIIITTKRGTAGETKVTFDQELGFNKALNLVGFAPWDQQKIDDFFGGSAQRTMDLASGRNFDWEDEIYGETGFITNSSLTVSGGNDKTKFFINGSIKQEDGIIKNSGFDRYSIRANIDHKLSDKFDFSLSSNYLNTDTDRSFNGNQNGTGASFGYNLSFTPPYADLFPDENGIYGDNPYFSENPLALRDKATNNSKINRFIQAFSFNWNILQTDRSFLKFSIQGGLDYLNSNTFVHMPEDLQFQKNALNPGDVFEGKSDQLNTNLQAFLIYNTNVSTVNFNTQVGVVKLTEDRQGLIVRGQGLLNGQTNANTATVQTIFQQNDVTVRDVGIFAQEEINWEDKIIATLGVRLDKSTLNLDQGKYYVFPKASVAINLANFDFWNISNINQLKIRAAYGETGGLPTFSTTFTQLNNVFIGGTSGNTLSTSTVDPNLEPETAREIELGIDIGFLQGRGLLEFTYYDKDVLDLIEFLVPASSTGITQITTNAGDLQNTGFEIALSGSPVKTTNFEWFGRVNWWTNDTEITRWDVPPSTRGGFGAGLGTYLLEEGFSPTTIVGSPFNAEDNRFTLYGDSQPDFQLSFYNQITFLKNFEFSFVLHHSKGNDNINLSEFLWDLGGTAPDWNEFTLYANEPATLPNGDPNPLFEQNNGNGRVADWGNNGAGVWVQDASFWKLREVGLYYTFPASTIQSAFKGYVEKIRIGVSGNQVWLSSDYRSYDPEVSQFTQDPIANSVEVTPFPSARRLMFHLNIGF